MKSGSEIDALGKSLMAEGWDALTPDPRRLSADVQEMVGAARAEAEPIGKLFDTAEGRAVLLWLMRKTLLRPPSLEMQAAQTAEAYALAAARREGQNAMVWMIVSALQVAHGESNEGAGR